MGGTIGPEPEYYVERFVKCGYEYCQSGFIPMRHDGNCFLGGYACHQCNGTGFRKIMAKERK